MSKKSLRWIILVDALVCTAAVGGYFWYQSGGEPGRFGVLVEGQVFHCRQPVGRQWGVLERHGIKRVIDLCAEVENPDVFAAEREACKKAGVEFVNIPVGDLLPKDEQIAAFLTAVRNRPGPVLFHCQHGRHRTSFMKACYRVLMDRWEIERAIAEMTANDAEPKDEKLAMTRKKLEDIRDNREAWVERTSGVASTTEPVARNPELGTRSPEAGTRNP